MDLSTKPFKINSNQEVQDFDEFEDYQGILVEVKRHDRGKFTLTFEDNESFLLKLKEMGIHVEGRRFIQTMDEATINHILFGDYDQRSQSMIVVKVWMNETRIDKWKVMRNQEEIKRYKIFVENWIKCVRL